MRNSRLLPYETIVQATTGEPEAVNAVLQHYGRYIRFSALVDGQVDKDAEDYITQILLAAVLNSLHKAAVAGTLIPTTAVFIFSCAGS